MNVYASLPVNMAMHFLAEEHGLNNIDYWCVWALFCNQDWEGVRTQLHYRSKRQRLQVSKFIPGEHYHVLGAKFDRLDLAVAHLEKEGYFYNGLKEVFVYREE